MRWLENLLHRSRPSPPTAWQNNPDPHAQRQRERQASWSELQAREFIRHGNPEFKPVVMTFQGPREVEWSAPKYSDDGNCPACGWAGIQNLAGAEKRCAKCGEQFFLR